MATDVKVPSLGESITEGTLAQWLKKAGDSVAADEPIASLETDKVTVEVPSPVAGVLSETVADEGETVEVGAVIARIDENGRADASGDTDQPAEKGEEATRTNPPGAGENPALRETQEAPETEQPPEEGSETSPPDQIMTLSPAVRRAVLEHHVDPTQIKGTARTAGSPRTTCLPRRRRGTKGAEKRKTASRRRRRARPLPRSRPRLRAPPRQSRSIRLQASAARSA
jgi:2-oxoglutarate dehydrogenase E2 component (dihydrolipoamide succinyltransferase)